MLHPLYALFYCLVLTIELVPLAAATKLPQSSVQRSPAHLRDLAPKLGNNPSPARLFTSTAVPALLDLPQGQFRDNMTATIESHLSPVLLQEIREFWFEQLEDVDSLIVASGAASLRWYAGGDEMDQQCV